MKLKKWKSRSFCIFLYCIKIKQFCNAFYESSLEEQKITTGRKWSRFIFSAYWVFKLQNKTVETGVKMLIQLVQKALWFLSINCKTNVFLSFFFAGQFPS